jgi:formylglycine-generating enzyme required for sulfatase activity
MLFQSADGSSVGTLPPPGFTSPPWEALAALWDAAPQPTSESVTLGPATVALGHDDDESKDVLFTPETLSDSELEEKVANHEYGWDNEHPRREVEVGGFRISWRPVSNGDYWKYWKEQKEKGEVVGTPRTWVEVDEEMKVWDSRPLSAACGSVP